MDSIWVALAIFSWLLSASLVMMHLYPKLAARHRDEDTNTVVRLVANMYMPKRASFGYRAPKNPMVVGMFTVSALLIAASVYLVLDMNVPFHGPIQVSDAPMRRALAEMQLE